MKLTLLTLGLLSAALGAHGQNRHTMFKDSAGAPSTYVAHWACAFDGCYRSVYEAVGGGIGAISLLAATIAQAQAAP